MTTEAEFVANYNPHDYPPFAVAVDTAIFTIRDNQLCIPLVERTEMPHKGRLALPSAFVGENESSDEAAWRGLINKTGVNRFDAHLEQLKTYSNPDRDPRMRVVSIGYFAIAPNLTLTDAGTNPTRWWSVNDLHLDDPGHPDAPEFAFDHAEIIADAVERVRSKFEYTTIAFNFLPDTFTLGELQNLYEIVLNKKMDKSNFRSKFLRTRDVLTDTDDMAPSQGGRPARLYRKGSATTIHPPLVRGEISG